MANKSDVQKARRAARQFGASPKERLALAMAGVVESDFEHDKYAEVGSGDRDSVGFLQQRPSQGWGKPGESVEQDALQFLEQARALRQKGFKGSAGQLAQAVQRSAFPERYDQARGKALELFGGKAGGSTRGSDSVAATGTKTVEVFDEKGFEKARKQAVVSQLLQKRNPGSRLLQFLPQEAPDRDSFTGQKEVTVRTPGTDSDGQKQGKQRSSNTKMRELFYDPGVNLDDGKKVAPIGGHADHVHFAHEDPEVLKAAQGLAKRMGLTITSTTGGKHAPGSFHYVGKAIDVGGPAKQLAAYNRRIAQLYG